MADFYEQFFSGLRRNPREKLKLYRAENRDEMIIARDIHFFSMCEHHLLPFFGSVHIAYIPENNTITGFSRLVEVVETIARRPQIQERMTTEIAEVLMDVLDRLVKIQLSHIENSLVQRDDRRERGQSMSRKHSKKPHKIFPFYR